MNLIIVLLTALLCSCGIPNEGIPDTGIVVKEDYKQFYDSSIDGVPMWLSEE